MNPIDLYIANKHIEIQDEKCNECLCYNCLNLMDDKCKERCFKRCKKNKYPWTKCKHYNSIW